MFFILFWAIKRPTLVLLNCRNSVHCVASEKVMGDNAPVELKKIAS